MIKTSDEGTGYCTQCEAKAREIESLKAELEFFKKKSANRAVGGINMEIDRDRWRGIAKTLNDALSISRGQWIHSVNKEDCLKALAIFDEAAGK